MKRDIERSLTQAEDQEREEQLLKDELSVEMAETR